jgi:LacI family transcriptional regulator
LAEEALGGDPGTRPTALLCANDLMAIGALEHCKAAGLRVPDDVSLTGFDDLPFVSLLTPSLTTVRQPASDMGARAVTRLFALLEGRTEDDLPIELFPTTLQLRESVGPPPPDTP